LLSDAQREPGVGLVGDALIELFSLHLQRWSFGTCPSTCSTCAPQPRHVGLLQFGHITAMHMGETSAVGLSLSRASAIGA
jgi:hypothetical protein